MFVLPKNEVKTKGLIHCIVTAKLISVYAFTESFFLVPWLIDLIISPFVLTEWQYVEIGLLK